MPAAVVPVDDKGSQVRATCDDGQSVMLEIFRKDFDRWESQTLVIHIGEAHALREAMVVLDRIMKEPPKL